MSRYDTGEIVQARVRKATPYRTFVEVIGKEGAADTGSVPEEEYSWSDERVRDYECLFREGLMLNLKVLAYRPGSEGTGLTLSRRCALFNADGTSRDPWVNVPKQFSEGQVARARVKQIAGNRAIGEITEGVKVMTDIEELRSYLNSAYRKKFPHPRDEEKFVRGGILYRDDKIAGIIRSVDTQHRIIALDVVSYLRSLADKASEFTLDQFRVSAVTDEPLVGTSHGGLGIRKVLLADDDDKFCDWMGSELETAGVDVLSFTTPSAVGSFLAGNPIADVDAFLIDLAFGEDPIAGLRICEQIRIHAPHGIVVLMTGRRIDSLSDAIAKLDVHDVLPKPFTLGELYACLRNLGRLGSYVAHAEPPRVPRQESKENALGNRLRERLCELAQETGADAGALFSFNPLNEVVDLLAWENEQLRAGFRCVRKHIHKSPIRDMIMRGESFDGDKNPHELPGKFLYFTEMFGFRRTVGQVIDVPGELGYCFFLFFRSKVDVDPIDIEKTHTAAADFRNIFMNVVYSEWAEEKQSFYLEGQLLAEVGHGLVTKLNGLPFLVERLKNATEGQGREGDGSATKTLNDLALLTDGALELGKKLTGISERLDVRDISLEDLLQRMIDFAKPTAVRMKIKIRPELCGKIPPVFVGRANIQVVFLNVVLNALQQTDAFVRTRGLIEVSTEYLAGEDLPIRVRVKDSGIGIHRKDYDRIFEPLYTTRTGGHGMGLAISRRIMGSLGGRIRVEESCLYEGTTFLIELPKKLVQN